MLGAARQPSTQLPVAAEAVEAGDDEAVAEALSKVLRLLSTEALSAVQLL